jgi:peptidoglycan/LPS O-acetylase OafA/YrhL
MKLSSLSAGVLLMGFGLAVGLMPFSRSGKPLGRRGTGPGRWLFGDSLVLGDIDPGGDQLRALGIALMIGSIYLNQRALLVGILELRPLSYLGKISYGIYMWQGFFLATGPSREAGQTWPPNPLVGLAMLCVVAPLSYHFFENPFLRLKQRFSGYAARAASVSRPQP